MKMKAILLTAMATMVMASSAFASVPSGYDPWVNVEKVTATEARNGGYCTTTVKSFAGDPIANPVNVPKVTPEEAKNGGYCKEIVKSFAGDIISMPNQDGPSISQEKYDEMMRGN